MSSKSVVLCILDGWGNGNNDKYDAIGTANKPCWDECISKYPLSSLKASSEEVGLPQGQFGNSEVGHINIGSGRIIQQDLPRINDSIENIRENINLIKFIQDLKKTKGTCHIMGLLSDGGVHSHQNHIFFLIDAVSQENIEVVIHAFLDGRDTPPSSAINYLGKLNEYIKRYNNVRVVTIAGRYYGMDRDNRMDRTEKAHQAIMFANGIRCENAVTAVKQQYDKGITDEFIEPIIVDPNYTGVKENDGLLIANFRSDRMLQIIKMIKGLVLGYKTINFYSILGMIRYSGKFDIPCLFSPMNLDNTLGQVISDHGLKQLRIAETEKYAHVTYFFNGGREEIFPGEERVIINSPKVKTYDLKPEMSAVELTDELVSRILSKEYSLIVVNYANADMVGHTGKIEATREAIGVVDGCLSKVLAAVKEVNSILVITADHGNAEQMFDSCNDVMHTAHTINTVPFIVCNYTQNIKLRDGKLCDIAPTILKLMDIEVPKEMKVTSLIEKA